jgi:rod shape-determining protein MreC
MFEFVRRNRILLTSGALLLLSVLLLSAGTRARPGSDPVGRLLLDRLAPFQIGFTWLGQGVKGLWSGYVDLVAVRGENERLRERVSFLEAEIVRLDEIESSNGRLAELLRFRQTLEGEVLGARVIGRDPLPWFRTMTVDRGAADGIRSGMAVLSPEGIVGQIAEVSGSAARVLLLSDANSGVDAIVQRTRARGIVQGGPEGICEMNYLRRDADVAVGDRIVTSGLDGIFPKGLVVGEVVEVSTRYRDLLKAAVVRPSAPLEHVEEVLIVDATAEIREPSA